MIDRSALREEAARVLAANDRGSHVAPSPPLYPDQWLWDSAYSAIGLSHIEPRRGAREIDSLLDGQWSNGMVPHMVFRGNLRSAGWHSRVSSRLWHSEANPAAPRGLVTSGVTQPPVLAEAVWRVGTKLARRDRTEFFAAAVPRLVRYHEWFYRERDIAGDGLVAAVHPWETGMDNTPPWMDYLRVHEKSFFVRAGRALPLDRLLNAVRLDTRERDPSERISYEGGLLCLSAMLRLRRLRFEAVRMRPRYSPYIEDVAINSILIRNNAILRKLAAECSLSLDDELTGNMERTASALVQLWDPAAGLFFSRDARTGLLLRTPTSASVLPLYTDDLPSEQRSRLIAHLRTEESFATAYPVPSVPADDEHFSDLRFWSGPTWVNVNWHLIDGAARAGESDLQEQLTESTLRMVEGSGMYEYFSPLDGRGLGARNFSWTAALSIDLLQR